MKRFIELMLNRPVRVEVIGTGRTIREKTRLGGQLRNRLTAGRNPIKRIPAEEAENWVTAETDHALADPGTVMIGIERNCLGRPVNAFCEPVGGRNPRTMLRIVTAGKRRQGKARHFSTHDGLAALECATRMTDEEFLEIWNQTKQKG